MNSIKYIDRASGKLIIEDVPGEKLLRCLYGSTFGKAPLELLLKRKIVSSLGGWFMNSILSKNQIKKFIKRYNIDLSEYQYPPNAKFNHFNAFFYRKIKPEKRPIGDGIVSPADGKALVFPHLNDVPSFFVKSEEFSLPSFLLDDDLCKKYQNGSMIIIRLAPSDYHRFHFPASGHISETRQIKGSYYSVSPLALKKSLRIFCQNKRTVCQLASPQNGDILMSEIGATMVGSIVQTYTNNTPISKGKEKGYFAFGGSTVVLLFEPKKIQLAADLIENTSKGIETAVKMGETIAY